MFNSYSDFLALDFDGVIADSIGECLVIGYNAYGRYTRSGGQIDQLDELGQGYQNECKRLRNFIRSGEDYVYINFAIDKQAPIQDQQAFDSFVKRYVNLKDTFYDLFYQERAFFSSTYTDTWIGLNPLYKGVKQFLIEYNAKARLYIITTKQIKYALTILTANHINLQAENCFTAVGRETKLKIIQHLLDKNEIPADRFYYVDDQVETLLEIKESGVHCLLAEWGYTDREQILRAGKEDIHGIQLDDFLRQFSTR